MMRLRDVKKLPSRQERALWNYMLELVSIQTVNIKDPR